MVNVIYDPAVLDDGVVGVAGAGVACIDRVWVANQNARIGVPLLVWVALPASRRIQAPRPHVFLATAQHGSVAPFG